MELRFPPKLLNFPFCFWSIFTQQISNQLRTTNCSKDTSLWWLFETSKPWTCWKQGMRTRCFWENCLPTRAPASDQHSRLPFASPRWSTEPAQHTRCNLCLPGLWLAFQPSWALTTMYDFSWEAGTEETTLPLILNQRLKETSSPLPKGPFSQHCQKWQTAISGAY